MARWPTAYPLPGKEMGMSVAAENNSLFEIDRELDLLFDEIQEEAEDGTEIRPELLVRFQDFCDAHSDKVDRIGNFLSLMESRALYSRAQAARLTERARSAENKVKRTENMVLCYLKSRGLRRIEGREFTLSLRKNSQDSVVILDEAQVPLPFREIEAKIPGHLWRILLPTLSSEERTELNACVRHMKPSNEAIKNAAGSQIEVPGAEVRRGVHLRISQ
jgi:Siphovirus Gp157